ncbi:hypothetical protein ACA910_012193 [Epithemia clementina (nom. ined.)]
MADSEDLLLSENSNSIITASSAAPSSSNNTTTTDAKIESDLVVVEEKLDLCNSLLNPGQGAARPSIRHDETVRAVIGFLEACAPRLVELISADPGLIGEAVLVRCFDVQERLTKLLEQVETLAMTETSASTTAAAPAPAQPNAEPEFLVDMESNPTNTTAGGASQPKAQANAKTTGEEDPFGNVLSATPPATSNATGGSEDFDDFFAERHQQNS